MYIMGTIKVERERESGCVCVYVCLHMKSTIKTNNYQQETFCSFGELPKQEMFL